MKVFFGEPLAPTRARKKQASISIKTTWRPDEDKKLMELVQRYRGTNIPWCTLSKCFRNKTSAQIAGRWEKVLNPRLVKGSWTREEDEKIVAYVKEHGEGDWARLALFLTGRTGKQCRERWKNHLDPNLAQIQEWTPEEDSKLIELHRQYGNAWTKIAKCFSGRTDNSVKNRWNSTLRKRLERIERGEPLVKKRGRKRKLLEVPMPAITVSDEKEAQTTPNSSPSIAMATLLESVPATPILPRKDRATGETSVAKNRMHLEKLLSNLSEQ